MPLNKEIKIESLDNITYLPDNDIIAKEKNEEVYI